MSKIFSARAECKSDIDRLLDIFLIKKILIVSYTCKPFIYNKVTLPDIYLEIHFEEDQENEKLLDIIKQVQDAHVILQTFKSCTLEDNNLIRDTSLGLCLYK